MAGRALLEPFKLLSAQELFLSVTLVSSSWKKAVYSNEILLHLLENRAEDQESPSYPLYIRVKKALTAVTYLLHIHRGTMLIWNINHATRSDASLEHPAFINSCRYVLTTQSKAMLTGGVGQELYCAEVDLKTGTVFSLSSLLRRHAWHAVALLQHTVFVSGGDLSGSISRCAEKYSEGKWTEVADMQFSRYNHTLCGYLQRIYAFGGSNENSFLTSIEYYDRQTWTVASMVLPTSRNYVSVWPLRRGLLLIAGYCPESSIRKVEMWEESTQKWVDVCVAGTDYSLNNAVSLRKRAIYIYAHLPSRDIIPLPSTIPLE